MGILAASLWLLSLWASTALAGYELRAWNLTGIGSPYTHKVWYGDGQAYVGSVVPAGVKVAFNFTVRGDRRQLMYIEVDRKNSPAKTPTFPDPTFLVANAGTGATSNLFFAHSAVDLTRENIYLFDGAEGFHWPVTTSGIAPGSAYMVPTSTPGTWAIKWITDAGIARGMGAIEVTLSTRL